MTAERDQLRAFRQGYLDYIEGRRDTAPSLNELSSLNRRTAESWITSLEHALLPSRPQVKVIFYATREVRDIHWMVKGTNRRLVGYLEDIENLTVQTDCLGTNLDVAQWWPVRAGTFQGYQSQELR